MVNTTFKVGDRVRIIDCRSIEPYELNKIGIIVRTDAWNEQITYVVDMGRPRRPNNSGDNETCWWLRESMIELVNKPNEQLIFDFMDE